MPKNVQMPDGTIVAFPDDMDDKAIHAEGLKYVQSKQQPLQTGSGMLTGTGISPQQPAASPNTTNSVIDMLRPLLAGAAGGVGASMGGPVGGVAGYTGVDALLQHLKTRQDNGIIAKATGMEAGGIPATLTNTAEQYGLGKIGEKLIGGGIRGVKALANADQPELMKLAPTTSQALEGAGYSKLAHVTKAVEDIAISNKNKALDRTAGKGFSEALDLAKRNDLNFSRNPNTMLDLIRMDAPDAVKDFSALDKVIKDPTKLQDTLSRAAELGTEDNLRKSLAGYKFMDIFNKATTRKVGENIYSDNVVRVNPQTVANEWLDPKMQDSLKVLFNSKQRGDIEQFFKNLAIVQDKIGGGSNKKLWLMEGGIGLGAGMLTGSPLHGAAGAAGIYIGAQAVSRILTNPKTARLAVALAGGEPLGVSEQLAGKLITRALQGTTVALINEKGEKVPGTFQEGRFEALQAPR